MIRVMIVDDEPYIRQGLQILINWDKLGFQISAEAQNGEEALKILRETDIDLVITDIKMPKMDGVELIGRIRDEISKDIHFIILSGFYEYEYAKKAIKYGVEDYILKPVQKEDLIHLLEECSERFYQEQENRKKQETNQRIAFNNYLAHLLNGISIDTELEHVKKNLYDTIDVRYIVFEYDQTDENYQGLPPEKKIEMQMRMYEKLAKYMGENNCHVFTELNRNLADYSIGLIYVGKFAAEHDVSEKEYIRRLYEAMTEELSQKIIIFIGQKVADISKISDSYKSAKIAGNFQHISNENDITFYDELKALDNNDKQLLYTDVMDRLIKAIEENNEENIIKQTDEVYNHLKDWVADADIIRINLDYLLFSLIDLIKKLDPEYDHEEVYRMISLGGRDKGTVRGSVKHIRDFSMEFAAYIGQLRQNNFGGVLKEVEREITDNYHENLNLKNLSEKYFINSAYLGQIFKKKFNVPFKDYLNTYRIERATEFLLRTDAKVYEIAEKVGFNNTDYFVSKFVQLKGITPLQYRKQYTE